MRDPVMMMSVPGPGVVGWFVTTLGGGTLLCAAAPVAVIAKAPNATPARRAEFVRMVIPPLVGAVASAAPRETTVIKDIGAKKDSVSDDAHYSVTLM